MDKPVWHYNPSCNDDNDDPILSSYDLEVVDPVVEGGVGHHQEQHGLQEDGDGVVEPAAGQQQGHLHITIPSITRVTRVTRVS